MNSSEGVPDYSGPHFNYQVFNSPKPSELLGGFNHCISPLSPQSLQSEQNILHPKSEIQQELRKKFSPKTMTNSKMPKPFQRKNIAKLVEEYKSLKSTSKMDKNESNPIYKADAFQTDHKTEVPKMDNLCQEIFKAEVSPSKLPETYHPHKELSKQTCDELRKQISSTCLFYFLLISLPSTPIYQVIEGQVAQKPGRRKILRETR